MPKQSSPPRTAGSPLRDVMAYGLCAGRSSIGRSNFSHDAIIGLPYINNANRSCMSTSERLLRAVQFNTITALRNRLGSEQFIEWLITPCHRDGMSPVEALESELWQEVAELAEDAMSEGVAQFKCTASAGFMDNSLLNAKNQKTEAPDDEGL
jgi:hypothetical protein